MFELIFNYVDYFISKHIPDVQSVEMYFDQFAQQEEGQSDNMPNPRVLVEIGEPEVIQSNINGEAQVMSVPVVLHIGVDMFTGVSNKGELKEANIKALRVNDLLYVYMHNLSSIDIPLDKQIDGLIIENFRRSSFAIASNPGNIKISTITFEAIIRDERAIRVSDYTESDVDAITISIV
jgi:hypothetical protein